MPPGPCPGSPVALEGRARAQVPPTAGWLRPPRPDSYPLRSVSVGLQALDLPARWLAPISLALFALVDLGLGVWLASQDHSPPRRPSGWPEGVPRSR